VSDSSNIAAVSNIAIQVYEHLVGVQFRDAGAGLGFHAMRYWVLPSSGFLCTLDSAPTKMPNGLKISQQDWLLFKALKDNTTNMQKAILLLNGRRKKNAANNYNEDLED
jgi:hypothetical protein